MADVQDIIVRYQSEVDQAVADLNKLADAQDDIIKGEKDQEKQAQKTEVSQREASKLRIANLKKEEAELRKLEAAKKKAFTVADISAYNSKIAETQKRISVLKNETSSFATSAKNIFTGVAGGLAAAFSAQAIIDFTQASINAFLEAEKNAQRLKFAITAIGGESELQFERLIKQSKDLQKITVFSGASIQQAQAALAAFGLTADEIERLIPLLSDYATVTSQDLVSAAQQVGAGLEGTGKVFGRYQIEVSATASRTENLSAIMQGFTEFQGAATEATKTLTGQLEQQKNEVGDLEELLGSKVAASWVKVKQATLEALLGLIGYNKEAEKLKENNSKAVADNFEKARDRIKAAGGDIVAEFEKRRDSIIKVNDSLKKSNEELEKVFGKLGFENQKKINREQIERNNEIIASNEEKLKKIKITIEDEVALLQKGEKEKQKALERTLLLDDLRKKSSEELNALIIKENEIQDDFTKKNVANINLVIKEQQKLTAEREKAAQEYEKNLAFLRQLQIQNIEDEKQQRIAAFEEQTRNLTSEGKLRADTIKQLEIQLVNDLNAIDEKRNFDPLFRAPEQTIDQKVVLRPEMQSQVDELIKQGKTEAEAIAEVINDLRKAVQSPVEGVKVAWIDANEQILASSLQLFGELTSLYDTFANSRIEQITKQKEADVSAIDEQIEANKKALENRQITNRTEEELNKNLTAQKVEAEKKADKEIRKIRRQQAIVDKANALFQIALNTAVALSNAANLATFGSLSPLIIALGAAQAAAVIAQPIPAFAKGTKGKQGSGLARVGEQGEETVFLPHGAKVLPNKQTKMYSGLMDSMFDMNADKYIYKHFVAPALMAQKREYESRGRTGGSFAENVANYGKLPPPTSTKINIPSSYTMSNTDELADKIASRLTNNRRRI